jgi:hypothetical protein
MREVRDKKAKHAFTYIHKWELCVLLRPQGKFTTVIKVGNQSFNFTEYVRI